MRHFSAIAGSIEALAKEAAEGSGASEQLTPINTSIREIDIVMAALSAAAADLRERARQRDDGQAQFKPLWTHAGFVFVKDIEDLHLYQPCGRAVDPPPEGRLQSA